MSAAATLAAWKDHARAHSRGCDNLFKHGPCIYGFDANPQQQANGALRGRVYVWRLDVGMVDIGGYKINADGTVAALPQELVGVLPAQAPAPVVKPDAFTTDDIEDLPLYTGSKK